MATVILNPVTFDDGAHVYPALHIPAARWNGWLSPVFSLETVVRMASEMNALHQANPEHGYPVFDFDGTTVAVSHVDGEIDRYEPLYQDGEPCYQIGFASWCWERVA